ncbi:uncharacterized protein LOC131947841 isoform X2 [Physella acuta]|uniref:uncharacterized protein LOC131947841 isoform X2 n=1 Tax=Physella acuta TaxID=109671 RepID=UPI0027DE8467|nr:uncharacterized protein LOC131947841 isoform X2 [Physella acuta]
MRSVSTSLFVAVMLFIQTGSLAPQVTTSVSRLSPVSSGEQTTESLAVSQIMDAGSDCHEGWHSARWRGWCIKVSSDPVDSQLKAGEICNELGANLMAGPMDNQTLQLIESHISDVLEMWIAADDYECNVINVVTHACSRRLDGDKLNFVCVRGAGPRLCSSQLAHMTAVAKIGETVRLTLCVTMATRHKQISIDVTKDNLIVPNVVVEWIEPEDWNSTYHFNITISNVSAPDFGQITIRIQNLTFILTLITDSSTEDVIKDVVVSVILVLAVMVLCLAVVVFRRRAKSIKTPFQFKRLDESMTGQFVQVNEMDEISGKDNEEITKNSAFGQSLTLGKL